MRVHLLFSGIVLITGACASWAQTATKEIGRLPSTLYLRSTFSTALPDTPASAPQQIKNLDEILKNGTIAVFSSDTSASVQSKAREFLQKNAEALELEKDASVFTLERATETLSGRHIALQQRVNGLRVIDSGIQLRVGPKGDLVSVTRNVVAVPAGKSGSIPTNPLLTSDQAQEIAWNDIRPTGELLEPITTEQAYLNQDKRMRMVYVVRTAVSHPLGYWEHRIDARTGEIVSRQDRRTPTRKRAGGQSDGVALQQLVSRAQAVQQFGARTKPTPSVATMTPAFAKTLVAKSAFAAAAIEKEAPAPGTAAAIVFSPNPVSTLENDQLKANDPPEAFEHAYVTVNLEGLTKRNGQFQLSNNSLRLEDFEPGPNGRRHAPSAETMAWGSKRESLAFHDAMSYYYVYNNLLYLRGLGYKGAKELFSNGIAIDSDGANGEDQSYFVPDSNRLSFGHGCVPDNEDTDVILHEFGHAIHYHINPQWGGGDARAIGEGFGDYWAVSHRARMKNGMKFGGRVFLWDGIASCWPGRRTDRVKARYDANRRYMDHEEIDGIVSDELWSTPLVASLLELRSLDQSFESIDTVVLEGMAAIGKNFTMRALATKTIEVAHELYPDKPHAGVFHKHFKEVGIIE